MGKECRISEYGKARLFLWEGSALFIGPLSDNSEHMHHAAQVGIGLERPFRFRSGNGWIETGYAASAANIPHQLVSVGYPVAVALFDWTTGPGRVMAQKKIVTKIKAQGTAKTLPTDLTAANDYFDHMIAPFSKPAHPPQAMDGRIAEVMQVLTDLDDEQIKAKELAARVGLSEGRFLHLFTEHAGLPLRRYVLWRRIIKSVDVASKGANMTTAAHTGGFSDSAHFSRVFRATFGLSPSKLFKNSRNIQVFTTL